MSGFNLSDLLYTDWQETVTAIVMPILLVFGLITNFSFILMVYRVPDMRITINMYLVSLAVADASYLITSISDRLVTYAISPLYGDVGNRGTAGCILTKYFTYTFFMASELHILVLAVERYYCVCRPLKAQVYPRKRAIRFLTAIWLVSSILSISLSPAFANFRLYCLVHWDSKYVDPPETYGVCRSIGYTEGTTDIDSLNIYFHIMQTCAFFASVIVSNVLYVLVLRHFRGISTSLQNRGMAQTTLFRNRQIRKYFNRMLCLNGLVYLVLLAPFNIYSLLRFVYKLNGNEIPVAPQVNVKLYTSFRLLLYVNSGINPLVYGATNPRYRKAFVVGYSTWRLTKCGTKKAGQSRQRPSTSGKINNLTIEDVTTYNTERK
ncbi:thyrotropin-releasing hormone receptor-like [Anneissia japonica]|uniref:thyrotropin-releasing hormone receptor-like n=1 Tax=Anneissia japonica TaxID=1529436 RepID=UPI00142573DE|nr:thyrotropin-releasing hormone receptor-like [Anneissia japonica]